ncbi:MAG: S49 family peptidase [Paracoccaceae bacterium]
MASPLARLRRSITGSGPPVVPAVRLQGTIAAGAGIGRQLNLAALEGTLSKAFKLKRVPFVALLINSPGGSAAQSHLIFRRIRELAERHDKKVVAFCEDVAASGGYMLACAADEIVADPSSIVGSIGVISKSFGFQDAIARRGVERRVYSAGGSKDFLDPFRPEREEERDHIKRLQSEVHRHFIDLVKERRGAKLSDEEPLFEGLFWSGATAQRLGLVDALGDVHAVVRDRCGEEASVKVLSPARKPIWRRLGGDAAGGVAEDAVAGLAAAVEERALWARYGL